MDTLLQASLTFQTFLSKMPEVNNQCEMAKQNTGNRNFRHS